MLPRCSRDVEAFLAEWVSLRPDVKMELQLRGGYTGNLRLGRRITLLSAG